MTMKQVNGWFCTATNEGKGRGWRPRVLDDKGNDAGPPLDREENESDASLNARQWALENPRYRPSIDVDGGDVDGYVAEVMDHQDKVVFTSPELWPTNDEAEEVAQLWIEARTAQEWRIHCLREERCRELAPRIAEELLAIDRLTAERTGLNNQIKAHHQNIRTLSQEANDPQVPLDFEPHGKEATPEQDDGIADDAPVADANGRHHDGPKKTRKKAGKKASKAKESQAPRTMRGRAGLDPAAVRHAFVDAPEVQ